MYENINTLIVDDDSLCRVCLKYIAEEAGITNIDVVSNEREAHNLLGKKDYQLLMLDTKYGSDIIIGPNIAKKAFEIGQKPKIIALSGSSYNEKLWQNQGFDYHFFDKTYFEAKDLKLILDEIISEY